MTAISDQVTFYVIEYNVMTYNKVDNLLFAHCTSVPYCHIFSSGYIVDSL